MPGISKLTPESSVLVGALTAIGVLAIYNHAVPNLTDLRSAPPHDDTIEQERKQAAIEGVVLLVGISLISRDLGPYVIGGAVLVGMDYLIKHANAVNPGTNKLDTTQAPQSLYSLPSYEETVDTGS